ncbi:MAG: DUF2971 domain-containing protein [Fibromonadales bacterium]|nr:DUF2971 domain-containing protein [Fibromonadales bacterium]
MEKEDAKSLIEKGNKFCGAGEFEMAIECFDKAVLLSPKITINASTFHNWGKALYKLADIKQDYALFNRAFEKYEESERLYETNSDKVSVFYDWGNALYKLAKINENESLFKEAFAKYDNATQCLDPDPDPNPAAYVFSDWGYALCDLAKIKQDESLFREAIDKYKKAIQIDENPWHFVCLGDTLYSLAKIKKDESLLEEKLVLLEEARDKYKEAIQLDEKYTYAFIKLGIVLANLAEIQRKPNLYKEATENFKKAKSILNIFVYFDKEEIEQIINAGVLYPLLDSGIEDSYFFNKEVKNIKKSISKEKLQEYKEIYIMSIFIISQLRMNMVYERSVAHYTKKTTVQNMLFNNSKFRLNAIDKFNDPTEGKILLDYLFEDKFSEEKFNTSYRAFVGCFTFRHDSLNQFRLYGKNKSKNQEGTGLSLIFCENFFSKESKMPTSKKKTEKTPLEKAFCDGDEDKKDTLFRCIYIDPKEQQVETVGQKEITKKKQKKYKKYIDEVFDIVNEKMEKLRNLITLNPDLNQNVIGNLLINLRCLTKHIAFKEEQECRIVKISHIARKKPYIEYEPSIIPRIEKVYFGPKAKGIKSFQYRLKREKLNKIHCKKSTNPLA